ncbi:MAG: PAS domain S-box protein [Pseudomonadota bacterium]|nr:PAS domain S-box protein [Pseudomonadota bacterium]
MTAQTLGAILTPNPAGVSVAASVASVLDLMETRRISCVLAVDSDNRPLGIFTEQDAVRLMAKGKASAPLSMADVMQQPVFTVAADLDTREAYRRMSERGYRHLVVVDGEGRLAGIVSEGDFMHHLDMEYWVELKTVASAMTPEPITLSEDASLEYILIAARDLSRIREQDAQLQLQLHALNAAGNAIIITDTVPHILWANAAFTTLTGYSLAEAIGRKPAELVKSGEQDQPYYQRMWDTILAGQVWRGELVNKHKDGSLYHEELTITPVSMEGKAVTHFVAIKQDISARRAAEATLRESEESWRGLFNSVTEAIYIQDGDSRFLDVNRGAERMYGYSRDEFIGQLPEFVAAPGKNDMEVLTERFRSALAGEAQKIEFWGRRKNGAVFPKDVWLNRGKYFGRDVIITVARDATERRSAEDELRRLAATDPLTGLANRRHFLDQMTLALARRKRHDTPTALTANLF